MDCEIRPGAIFHNVTTVENVLRIEAVDPDGSILASFPGHPEFGLTTIDPEQWIGLKEKYQLSCAPLAV